jgi:hypothetical protein
MQELNYSNNYLTIQKNRTSTGFLKRQSNPISYNMYVPDTVMLNVVDISIWVPEGLSSCHVLWHKCVYVILTKYKLNDLKCAVTFIGLLFYRIISRSFEWPIIPYWNFFPYMLWNNYILHEIMDSTLQRWHTRDYPNFGELDHKKYLCNFWFPPSLSK